MKPDVVVSPLYLGFLCPVWLGGICETGEECKAAVSTLDRQIGVADPLMVNASFICLLKPKSLWAFGLEQPAGCPQFLLLLLP